ncbi:mediator of RNA polymerase II transcription subunit 15a isoform X2 [Helianthus annuus]|nr:mediator of RNA polymerase II transcription subunit 15a isoform X2 [Helianthus annuus]XP_035843455.1 mediator of RNA polymerase II transcription subunit 15a isoform X2 [Helianthus annuus]
MDIFKKHLPFSAYERLQELKKIAERVEEEVYTAATSQSEYSRKICLNMLILDTRLQHSLEPLDSTNQTDDLNGEDWQEEVYRKIKAMKELYLLESSTGNPHGEDWQEEVYQKIKAMKDLYLLDLNAVHQKVISKLQQHVSLQLPENERVEKLKALKYMLERYMQFVQISKRGIRANHKDKLGTYESQIIIILSADRRLRAATPQQQTRALPLPSTQYLQQSEPTHSLTLVQSGGPNIAATLSGGSNAQQNMMNSIQPI